MRQATRKGQPYLFSIGLDFVGELDNHDVSARLREQFQGHGKALPPQAFVIVQQLGSKWGISVGDKCHYYIRRENQTLNVYEQPNELVESDKVDYRVIHQAHPTEQKSFLQPLKGLTCWQMVLYFLLVTIVIFSLVVIVIQANQIATLQTDNASLHGSISTLEAEKKALQGTITTLEAEKKALQGTITTLQAEINRLQTATPPPR